MLTAFRLRSVVSAMRPAVPLSESARPLVVALVVASAFDQYDATLFHLLLPHTQKDLQIPDAGLGVVGAVVRISALGAPLVLALSGRVGTRRLLLWTIGGFSLSTGLTALSTSVVWLTAAQAVSRVLLVSEGLLAVAVLSAALPSSSRGWAIGLVGSLGALGAIAAYALYPAIVATPLGWRGLYAFGAPPAILAWLVRRRVLAAVGEDMLGLSHRRADHGERRSSLWSERRDFAPLVALALIVGVWALAVTSAWFFVPKHLLDAAGWTPRMIGAVAAGGGLLAIPAGFVAGRMSDRVGRRRVTLWSLALGPPCAYLVFNADTRVVAGTAWVGLAWSLGAANVLALAYATELAPRARQTAGAGTIGAAWILGGTVGLVGESILFGVLGSHHRAVTSLLLIGALAVGAFAAARLPETTAPVRPRPSP